MFEVGDIVVALDSNGDMIVESIGKVIDILHHKNAATSQSKSIKIAYWKTSPLYRNWWEYYYENDLKKLSALELFDLLQTRDKMVQFKSMKEGVL